MFARKGDRDLLLLVEMLQEKIGVGRMSIASVAGTCLVILVGLVFGAGFSHIGTSRFNLFTCTSHCSVRTKNQERGAILASIYTLGSRKQVLFQVFRHNYDL